ncbi:ATP-binding protein [Enterococcus sp. AZ103]|uniref:ATP-binding protein n=1 Tax=Enterococcus sp. AZ103 TaxID=2774628 RepID=UPI003F1EB148
MENMGSAIEQLMEKVLVIVGKCPECNGPMRKWKNTNPDGSERCAPVCTECGYKEMINRNNKRIEEMAQDAKQSDAINRLKNSSIIANDSIWSQDFSNYKITDDEVKQANYQAKAWISRVISDWNKQKKLDEEVKKRKEKNVKKIPTLHAILTGKPGAGKTHLSMAMIHKIMSDSNYQISCSIVSYQELYEQLKFVIGDPIAKKEIQGTLMTEIKKSDFVVIDDLGAELGRMEENNKATEFNVSILTGLAEARVNKATVYTTNLSSKQLKSAYGERVFSRMLNNTGGNEVITFETTKDKRRNSI